VLLGKVPLGAQQKTDSAACQHFNSKISFSRDEENEVSVADK